MGELKTCPACKQIMPDVYLFCGYCGAALDGVKKRKRRSTHRPSNDGSIKVNKSRQKPYSAYMPGRGGKFIGSYKTYEEASNALAVALASRPKSARSEWTVKDFYNYYITSDYYSKLAVSHQAYIKSSWHYCEHIGDLIMRDVKTQEWQSCVNKAINLGRSKSTVNHIKELAGALCQEAMRDDVISRDYSKLLQMGGKAVEKREIFTAKELQILKDHDDDIRVKFILILTYTGMRISELLETPVENVHDKYLIGGKKTEAGRNRIIPLLPPILPYIEFFKRDSGLLIHRDGKPVTPNYAREKWFYGALVDLGMLTEEELQPGNKPRITPHYARHSFTTLARQAGVPEDVIKRIVGHTSYKTTDAHYVELEADFLYNEALKICGDAPSDTENA